MTHKLFQPAQLGELNLSNRVVMAPLTRSRAIGNTPNALMATYYGQRSSAGLLIAEGTSPSPNGLGYARIPGIYSEAQIAGWKLVTDAVHRNGGKIFLQLMHTGRVSHAQNLPPGAEVIAPSAVRAAGEMYTDVDGMQPFPVPRAMTTADIQQAIGEYAAAASNAIAAGFDGIELHAANGYLIEQFIAANTNLRTDAYGGNIENRIRFAVEVAEAAVAAIGKDRVGMRLSPYGNFNDIQASADTDALYEALATKLNALGLVYVHLLDHSSMGAPEVKPSVIAKIHAAFKGKVIVCGGYTAERAKQALESGEADFVAFGRPLLANPDLVERLRSGAALNAPDMDTFYTPGEKGYTDYPFLQSVDA